MPESEALQRATAALERLTEQGERLGDRLDAERIERHVEQAQMRKVGRRAVAALGVAVFLLFIAGGIVAYSAHERDLDRKREVERIAAQKVVDDRERCKAANVSRQGNRDADRILIDELFGAAAGSSNPHSPDTQARIEALRVQVQKQVADVLKKSQPITECH